jgi:hypothetical protein
MRRFVLPLAVAAFATSSPTPAGASPNGEIDSALYIAKSSNKNQVHYAVEVDGQCEPVGPAPVHPYWRMLEHGPEATEPLTAREERAFGLAQQSVDGSDVRVVLRGLPARPITLHTFREGTRCASTAAITIHGKPARLTSVYVKQSLFGISYVELDGFGPSGASLSERLSP